MLKEHRFIAYILWLAKPNHFQIWTTVTLRFATFIQKINEFSMTDLKTVTA